MKTDNKQPVKTGTRPKPFLTAKEAEQLQPLPKGAWPVWNANLHLATEYRKDGDELFWVLIYIMVCSHWWRKFYSKEERDRMWCFIEALRTLYQTAKEQEAVLDAIDDENMEVFYLIP